MKTITYVHALSAADFLMLRDSVGFKKISLRQAQNGLEHTAYIVAAVCEGEPVGCARLISDGGYVAYIADVIVKPGFQRRGIGKAMVNGIQDYIREQLDEGEFAMTCLMAATDKEPFYNRLGFLTRPNDELGAGMTQWIEK